jgi:hypothetical protein
MGSDGSTGNVSLSRQQSTDQPLAGQGSSWACSEFLGEGRTMGHRTAEVAGYRLVGNCRCSGFGVLPTQRESEVVIKLRHRVLLFLDATISLSPLTTVSCRSRGCAQATTYEHQPPVQTVKRTHLFYPD